MCQSAGAPQSDLRAALEIVHFAKSSGIGQATSKEMHSSSCTRLLTASTSGASGSSSQICRRGARGLKLACRGRACCKSVEFGCTSLMQRRRHTKVMTERVNPLAQVRAFSGRCRADSRTWRSEGKRVEGEREEGGNRVSREEGDRASGGRAGRREGGREAAEGAEVEREGVGRRKRERKTRATGGKKERVREAREGRKGESGKGEHVTSRPATEPISTSAASSCATLCVSLARRSTSSSTSNDVCSPVSAPLLLGCAGSFSAASPSMSSAHGWGAGL